MQRVKKQVNLYSRFKLFLIIEVQLLILISILLTQIQSLRFLSNSLEYF